MGCEPIPMRAIGPVGGLIEKHSARCTNSARQDEEQICAKGNLEIMKGRESATYGDVQQRCYTALYTALHAPVLLSASLSVSVF